MDEAQKLEILSNPALEGAVKIRVNKEGWHRLTQPQLVQAGLRARANPRNLQLYVDGVQQPIIVFTCGGLVRSLADPASPDTESQKNTRLACREEFGKDDWIEFYGTGVDTPWTDTRTYRLVEGIRPGERMEILNGLSLQSGASSLLATIEFKPKTIYWLHCSTEMRATFSDRW